MLATVAAGKHCHSVVTQSWLFEIAAQCITGITATDSMA
jgi:hypothetical protein